MKSSLVAPWLTGFILLWLYVNLLPLVLPADRLDQWAAYWAGFFLLAFLTARFILGLRGIGDLGLARHSGWFRNLLAGFAAGLLIYAVKYAAYFALGRFAIIGLMPVSHVVRTALLGLAAMLFSSLLNDILVRGYVFSAAQAQGLSRYFLPASAILYILTDSVMAGFSWVNIVFSGILGITFAYSVLKTGTVWMSFGLHWGGNTMFRLMYGFGGQGIVRISPPVGGLTWELLGLGITALMFPLVYLVLKKKKSREVTGTVSLKLS